MLTIKDIAFQAGVAPSTVSKVLNNYHGVSAKTKQQVMKVIEKTRFTPNPSARRLVQKNSRTIGFIMSGLEESNPNDIMPFQILRGALSCVQKHGYEVVFYPITSLMQLQKSYERFCNENNLAGIVISGLRIDDDYYIQAANSAIPCVAIDFLLDGENNYSISINNTQATRHAVSYLIKRGHTKIGAVNGSPTAVVGLERYDGYCKALSDHKLPLNEEYVINGGFQEEIAYNQTLHLLQTHPEITALFCSSDVMCMGIYRAAEKLKLRIPQDLSVVGFDDFPVASYVSPSLSTVRQDFYSFGFQAILLLTRVMEGFMPENHQIFLDYELICRDSVASIQK